MRVLSDQEKAVEQFGYEREQKGREEGGFEMAQKTAANMLKLYAPYAASHNNRQDRHGGSFGSLLLFCPRENGASCLKFSADIQNRSTFLPSEYPAQKDLF